MVLPVLAPAGYETRLGPPAGCAEPDRGKRRPDSALRLEGYLGQKFAWPGEPVGRLVRDRDGGVSPLAAGAAAAHDPARPIQPGGRAKPRGRDQQLPDRREPDAARGYVHALTWSAAHSPPAGEPPSRGQRRR